MSRISEQFLPVFKALLGLRQPYSEQAKVLLRMVNRLGGAYGHHF